MTAKEKLEQYLVCYSDFDDFFNNTCLCYLHYNQYYYFEIYNICNEDALQSINDYITDMNKQFHLDIPLIGVSYIGEEICIMHENDLFYDWFLLDEFLNQIKRNYLSEVYKGYEKMKRKENNNESC